MYKPCFTTAPGNSPQAGCINSSVEEDNYSSGDIADDVDAVSSIHSCSGSDIDSESDYESDGFMNDAQDVNLYEGINVLHVQ